MRVPGVRLGLRRFCEQSSSNEACLVACLCMHVNMCWVQQLSALDLTTSTAVRNMIPITNATAASHRPPHSHRIPYLNPTDKQQGGKHDSSAVVFITQQSAAPASAQWRAAQHRPAQQSARAATLRPAPAGGRRRALPGRGGVAAEQSGTAPARNYGRAAPQPPLRPAPVAGRRRSGPYL